MEDKNDEPLLPKQSTDLHCQEEEEEAGLERGVDWLGRPLSSSHGGWKAASFLLGSHTLQSLAMSGCTVNLVIFMVREMRQDNASIANAITTWLGTCFLTSIFGSTLGDAYWGRLWAAVFYESLFVLGLVMFAIFGTIITAEALPSSFHVTLFYTALYIMGLGTASLVPNVLSLGGDQFDSPKQISAFISMHIAASGVGTLLSTSVLSYVENEGHWKLGFWLSAGIGILGFILFLAGMPRTRQLKPGKNPLLCIVRVIRAAIRNRKAYAIEPSSKDLRRAPSFRWLDKAAALKVNPSSGEHLECTMEQVVEVKSVFQLLPFWVCSILVAAAMVQKDTLFVLQADTMENRVWGKFVFPPSSMSLFSLAVVVMGAPAYTMLIEPLVSRERRGMSSIIRMGAGLVVAICMFCAAAVVEAQRLRIVAEREASRYGDGKEREMVPMSIFWLVPQYMLDGFTTVLFACGHLDFNYTYSPHGMRSLATAISLSGFALGSYLSSFLVEIVTSFTSWIPNDLNKGHLDYFYWNLGGLLLLTSALFVASSKWVLSFQSQCMKDDLAHDQENLSAKFSSSCL